MTLLEAAVVISLLGVVLAVFVPTFFRELRVSKVSEAPEHLADLHRRAASYYAAGHQVPNEAGEQGAEATTRTRRKCIPPAAGPAPLEVTSERQAIDFFASETVGHPTWEALDFNPPHGVRYRYSFLPAKTGCGIRGRGTRILFRAEGNLDADDTLSTFERTAAVSAHGDLRPIGVLEVVRRTE